MSSTDSDRTAAAVIVCVGAAAALGVAGALLSRATEVFGAVKFDVTPELKKVLMERGFVKPVDEGHPRGSVQRFNYQEALEEWTREAKRVAKQLSAATGAAPAPKPPGHTYQTLPVLAGAYEGGRRTMLTHVVEHDAQGTPIRVLCGDRVELDSMADPHAVTASERDGVATCPRCASKDPRLREAMLTVDQLIRSMPAPAVTTVAAPIGYASWAEWQAAQDNSSSTAHRPAGSVMPAGDFDRPSAPGAHQIVEPAHHYVSSARPMPAMARALAPAVSDDCPEGWGSTPERRW